MLLRRITKHVTDQNWFAVFIDFIIVIVGVFIGIQVANWNTERINTHLEKQYLQRLFDDLNGTIDDYNTNVIWDYRQLHAQYSILQQLNSGVENKDERNTFQLGLAWVGIHNPQRRRWGTVEELVSTGNISLISDISLRSDISRLSAWYDRNNEVVKGSAARMIQLRTQLIKKYRIIRFDHNTSKPFAVVQYDFKALSDDQEFINTLSSLHLEDVTMVTFAHASMFRYQAFRDKLAGVLNLDLEGLPEVVKTVERPWAINSSVME